jgi:hypothetical protein
MAPENITELEELLKSEANGRQIVLDLTDLTLVSQEVVNFLERCETDSITFQNCPAYIREWITRQRRGGAA